MNSVNSIYKVHIVRGTHNKSEGGERGGGVRDKLIVFFGNDADPGDLRALFASDPTNKRLLDRDTGNPIFSNDELVHIKNTNIDVVFSRQSIYLDDTILTIKLKILLEIRESSEISIDELFLFCAKKETLLPRDVYNTLTQKKRIVLSRLRIDNMLQNIKQEFADGPALITLSSDKDDYSYDDILKLDMFDKNVNVVRMLGQKLFLIDSHYPFPYNPYDITHFDNLLYTASINATSTMNNNLLLDNGNINNNTIYVTTAEDVLQYHASTAKPLNEQYLMNIYFPTLVAHQITSLAHLRELRSSIMKETNTLLSESTQNAYLKEDMLHAVSRATTSGASQTFVYDTQGIMEIRFAVQQDFDINAPLDTIFKLIRVDKQVPFTKLNPGVQREPMYRLYGDQKTKDNRVIPILTKTKVFQLSSNIGKSRCVAAYIQIDDMSDVEFVCEFQENGDMVINITSPRPITLSETTNLVLRYANPFMKQISDFLAESGYKVRLFSGLYENNIDILHIKYGYDVHLNNYDSEFDIKRAQPCLTPAFIINSFNVLGRNGASMRYRKVSNFNKMTSKEAFVVEQIKRREGYHGDMLMENLMDAHDIGENEAREIIARVATQLTIDTGGIGAKTMRIRSNPGFAMKIIDLTKKSLKTKRKVRIEISGIDNIFYIQCLDTYINSLIALSVSYKELSGIIPDMDTVCSLSQNEDVRKEDILSASDKNIVETQELIIDGDVVRVVDNAQPIAYEGEGQQKTLNALDLIYGNDMDADDYADYDDYDDEESGDVDGMKGGAGSRSRKRVHNSNRGGVRNKNVKKGGNTNSNIVGMRLSKPNPFVKIMEEADNDLFLAKGDGNEKFVKYSTKCDSAYGRQPVLMTQDEYNKNVEYERTAIIEKYGKADFDALGKEQQDSLIKKETQLDERFVVTYGSSREKRNVYSCPRYWCLKTNSYIYPGEMRQKKTELGEPVVDKNGHPVLEHPTCGGIIPRGQDKVKDDGNFVYEFTGQNRISSKTGNYLANYPSFLPRDKHPNGKCLPCCFKFTESASGNLSRPTGRINTNNECSKEVDVPDESEEKSGDDVESTSIPKTSAATAAAPQVFQPAPPKGDALYILDQATTPVHLGRWGFLPIEVQYLLKDYSSDYLADLPRMQIKEDIVVLLRHGVETEVGTYHPQHFMSAMADVMFYNDPTDRKTLREFKEYLVKKLTIERFAKYQNGNLVQEFYSDIDIDSQDIEPYKSSALYSPNNEQAFRKLVRAFDNFKAFLIVDSTTVDHTYVWDFICDSGIHDSHPNGANLIILDIPEDDNTTKVEIICPTNHYSSLIYNREKPSIILIKRGDIYEPMYSLKKTVDAITFQRYFAHVQSEVPNITGEMTPQTVLTFLDKIVNPIYQNKCSPMASLRREHKLKTPILLKTLLAVLKQIRSINVEVIRYVFNYSYKTIAVEVKFGEHVGIIPCYPSGNNLSKDTKTTFIDDDSIYRPYNETIEFLNKVVHHSKGRIPASPAFKLVDDEMIVGIITITNQVILISNPVELSNVNDDIAIMRHKGYTRDSANPAKSYIDVNIPGNKSIDTERKEYVNKIRLETNFFNAFRNTVRILLHDYANLGIKEEIDRIISSTMLLYDKKLSVMTELIKKLVASHVYFKEDVAIETLKNVSLCINVDKNTCSERNPVCIMESKNPNVSTGSEMSDGSDLFSCALVIPKKNLLTSEIDNETVYVYKIADQLLRYTRIRRYLLDTTQFLGIGDAEFNLDATELVLSHSSLKNEYFNDLVPYTETGYDTTNTYDTVNPSFMTTAYANEYDYNKVLEMRPFTPFSTDPTDAEETRVASIEPVSKKILVKGVKRLNGVMKLVDDESNMDIAKG